MKLIIAGSRTLKISVEEISALVNYHKLAPTEIVCGGAPGVDMAGAKYAMIKNIFVKMFPADWDNFGKAAGPVRNRKMAKYGDALLLIWDGKSPGSKSMKSMMKAEKKPIYEAIVDF